MLAVLTEGEGHLHLMNERGQTDAALAVALAGGDPAESYALVLGSQGVVGRLAIQSRAQIRQAMKPATLALSERLNKVQARLAQLALEPDVRDPDAHAELLQSLRAERDAAERTLRQEVVVAQGPRVGPVDVQAALPPHTALVDLFVHASYVAARYEDGVFAEAGHWGADRLGAWILRSGDKDIRHVDLGPVQRIEVAIEEHLSAVSKDGALRGVALVGAKAPADMSGSTLRQFIWEPLEEHVRGCRTVFLSPDGGIGRLPFETLPDEAGRYLIEDVAFVYLSDGVALVERRGAGAALSSSMLVVGDVDYDRAAEAVRPAGKRVVVPTWGAGVDSGTSMPAPGDDTPTGEWTVTRSASPAMLRRALGRRNWMPIPGTRRESLAIAEVHRSNRRGERTETLLQGDEATETRLKLEMPRHAILHLATHGFFQPDGLPSMWDAAPQVMREAPDDESLTKTARQLTGLHPGLLSGLVFAGANRSVEDDVTTAVELTVDDGYLTASEVGLLDLSGTDLVVLSACETGLGRPQAGAGLLGLRRAFHMAGADTVISSLWAVKDESTSKLMQDFYVNLLSKDMGRHEALRAAQLAMLQKNRAEHGKALPSTWGAFVLSGEWRR